MAVVPTRYDPELLQRIDALAAKMGMKRSTAIRFILRRAVDTPAIEAVLVEEVNGVHGRLQERMQSIRRRFLQILIEELGLSFAQTTDDVSPDAELPALPARSGEGAPPDDVVDVEVLEGLGGVEAARGRRGSGKRKRAR